MDNEELFEVQSSMFIKYLILTFGWVLWIKEA